MARKGALVAGAALLTSAAFVAFRTKQAEKQNPPIGRFVEVDGVRLHYIERGSGEPLVLLHGNGSMVQDFLTSGLVERAAEHHRVFVFDRPGYGWSERPRGRIWTPAAQARLLHKAAAKIGAGRVHLLGHSWGTLVALEWALRYREDVASLTLASGYYFPTFRVDALLISGNAVPLLGDLTRATVTPVAARLAWPLILKALFGPAPVDADFEGFPRAFALSPLSLRAASEEAAMMVPAVSQLQDRYVGLTCPVSIIAGAGDRIVDAEEQSVRLHDAIPGSRLRVLPQVGHMVHHTSPVEVLDALALAVAGTASPGLPAAP
jgi:pimeloyl-ACP methyl ester carboxylesterase